MIPEHVAMLSSMDGSNWGDGPQRYWYPEGHRDAAPPEAQPPRDLKSFFAGDRRKALRWSIGVTAAAVLAGGGAIGGVALTDHGSQPGQGTALSAAVNATGSASPGTGKAGARRTGLARLRALRGVHGEVTVRTKNGFRELAWERGLIESVNAQDIVVRSPDGTTWTWTLAGNTTVRDKGAKGSTSSLAGGDQVLVAGQQNGSTRTARVIVIPKRAAGASSADGGPGSSPAPSGS